MREILFRGKRTDNGEWVEGSLVLPNYELPNNAGLFLEGMAYICTSLHSICVEDYDRRTLELAGFVQVDPTTVGQYTGLCDKNGKKIFEGDIIKGDNGWSSTIAIVRYGLFKPTMFYDLLADYRMLRPKKSIVGLHLCSLKSGEEMLLTTASNLIEIIGNIHDNPELLEG